MLTCFIFIGLLWNIGKGNSGENDRRKDTNVREYCRWEVLNASCPHNSVVMMKSAFYGRMKNSRCTELEYYVGCSHDALFELDQHCSGKRRCEVSVPIPDLHEIQPCPKDLQTYLEADFTCIGVHTSHSCSNKQNIKVVAAEEGYFSSHVTDESSQGSRVCPWQLVAAKGQHINLTLVDFNLALRKNKMASSEDGGSCIMYGTIKEENQKEQTICAKNGRMTRIYSSKSNTVMITLTKQNKDDSPFRFLIKYEVTGCADPESPPLSFTILERKGDRLTISCKSNEHQLISHLTCHDRRWVGDIRNCSETSSLNGVSDFFTDGDIYTHGLIVSIVTGILLGVIVGACLLFAVLAYRKKRHYRAHQVSKRSGGSDFQVNKNDKQHSTRYSTDQQIRKIVPQDDICDRIPSSDLERCSFRTAHNKQTTPIYVRHAPQQQTCEFFQHHHLNDLHAPCKVTCQEEHLMAGEQKLNNKCATGELKLTDYGFVSDTGLEKDCELEGCFQTAKRSHHCHNTLLSNHHYDTPNFQKNFMPFDIIEN